MTNYYILKPGTTDEFVTGEGTFTVTMDAAKDLSGIADDKYHTVSLADPLIDNADGENKYDALTANLAVTAEVTSYGASAQKEGSVQYVKEGEKITVKFTITDASANGDTQPTGKDIKGNVKATGGFAAEASSVEILASANSIGSTKTKEVTLDVTVGTSQKDLTLTCTLVNT